MPIYLDRHKMQDKITAKDVARMHQEDLEIEHKFNCRGLTYWCDEKRKIAFCLIEAPNKKAIQDMHNFAHGSVPHSIIEVESNIVESFLGRVVDPVKSKNSKLNIINEPAFRIIMVCRIKILPLNHISSKNIQKYNDFFLKKIKHFKGNIVKHKRDYYLISFDSVTNAILCAMEIQTFFNHSYNSELKLSIGLSAGVPITDKKVLFEDTIKTAEQLCYFINETISITTELKDLYESENINVKINKKKIYTISNSEELFLVRLLNYLDIRFNNTSIKTKDIENELGCSKSTLYRKMISITGKSINNFITDYRLNKASILLNDRHSNISEISYKVGFNTPAYFSKKFKEVYGILPSDYLKIET